MDTWREPLTVFEQVRRVIEWLATPCPTVAWRLGYLREAVSIRAGCHQELWYSLYGAELPLGCDHWFWDIASLSEVQKPQELPRL